MKRLLVIRFGAMGDLVHAASAAQVVKRQYPALAIDWLSAPIYTPLLKSFRLGENSDTQPLINQVLEYDKRLGWPGLFKLAGLIQRQPYDAIINLHPSTRTWLLTSLSSFGRGNNFQAVKYHKQKLSIRGEGQRQIERRHAAEDFLQPFHALFPDLQGDNLSRSMPPMIALDGIQPVEVKGGKSLIALVIGVGRKRGSRGWPLAHYEQLIRIILQNSPAEIVLVGGSEEVESGQALKQAFLENQRVRNNCGRYSLLETASVFQTADVVIGGDTGPLHLASCLDVPIIGIFGPTSIRRTGALGPEAKRIHLLPPASLSCWPCELPECPLPGSQYLACMKDTSPQQVWETLKILLVKPIKSPLT